MGKKFSFDIGTTSVGWAVFESNGNQIVKLLDAGSRVFDEPRDPKTKESNAVARRKARALRRQIRRRVARRKLLVNIFKKEGWLDKEALPPYGFSSNPYKLRKEALDRVLNKNELAEVFFNIGKRRGFKSNRKLDRVSTEANQIVSEANQIQMEMDNTGMRTLGEYLFSLIESNDSLFPQRIRCKKTLRSMYFSEFEEIIKKQKELSSNLLTEKVIEELRRVIFYQLPFELQPEKRLKTLGKCPLENGERRAYKYDPLAIEFRIRKTVNNIRIIDQRNNLERKLEEDEREALFYMLLEKPKETFTSIKSKLGLLETQLINLETSRTDHIKGDQYYSVISKYLKKNYKREYKEIVQRLCTIFHEIENVDELKISFSREQIPFGLSFEQLEELYNQFPLGEDGTSAYSVKALEGLNRELQKGFSEFEAVNNLYPNLGSSKEYELLPLPEEKINNPTVNRTIHQFRRVFNALVKTYGKPEKVAVELAKEIKQPKWKKEEESKIQKLRERERARIAGVIRDAGIDPSRDQILRVELAESQGFLCPYTGKTFGLSDVLAEGRLEVDHILPFSRSLDDSKGNLVIAFASANAEKDNKTPGEWLRGVEYEKMIERISKMKFGYGKKKRFYENAKADVDSFISQQLNDTRYASKFIFEYVSKVFSVDKKNKSIQSLRGSHTAWLRKLWGLNQYLGDSAEKNRNDLRHHAIDAIVIGMCSSAVLNKLALSRGHYGSHFNLDLPYPNLHSEIKPLIERMIVSRKLSRKISGPFHAQTSYSPGKESEKPGYISVAHRVNVTSLTWSQAQSIVDPVIKGLVWVRLKEKGWDGLDDSKAKELLKEGALEELKMKSGVPVKRVRVRNLFAEKTTNQVKDKVKEAYFKTVVNDGNHSIGIFKDENSDRLVARIKAVFDANKIDEKTSPILNLHKSDSVEISGFGVGYVKNISVTTSDGPYVEIAKDRVANVDRKAIDVDFKRFQSSEKLVTNVKKINISILGKK